MISTHIQLINKRERVNNHQKLRPLRYITRRYIRFSHLMIILQLKIIGRKKFEKKSQIN